MDDKPHTQTYAATQARPEGIVLAGGDVPDTTLPAVAMDFLSAAFYVTAAQLEKLDAAHAADKAA